MPSLNTSVVTKRNSRLSAFVDEDVLRAFKDKCKENGLSVNKVVEMFMEEYLEGHFYLKFVSGTINNKKTARLDTTIYSGLMKAFRRKLKEDNYPINRVIESFMIGFIQGNYIVGFVHGNNVDESNIDNKDIEFDEMDMIPKVFLNK